MRKLLLPILCLVVGICIGFELCRSLLGYLEMRQEEQRLEGELAYNLALYQQIKAGLPTSSLMSSAKVGIAANVRTYQYYKKHIAGFEIKDPKFSQLLEQAYEAVPGAKGDALPIPGVPTTIPDTNWPPGQ